MFVSTVRNTAINYIQKEQSRQKRRDVFEQGVVAETPAQELSLDELMILSENRQRIKDAWRKLAEGDRFLLEGKYLLGLTDAELAHQMNCKPESISFCWEQSHLAWQRILVNLVF
jgi:RNA polymerase sigma-70 factor (ECF subfamily)